MGLEPIVAPEPDKASLFQAMSTQLGFTDLRCLRVD